MPDWSQLDTLLACPACKTILGRDKTERPVTLSHGTNRLVGNDPAAILAAADEVLGAGPTAPPEPPPLRDGHAGERIAAALATRYAG